MNHSITSHPCDNVSLAQLTELAQSGNSEAQYILGRLYNDERIDGSEEDKLSFIGYSRRPSKGIARRNIGSAYDTKTRLPT